MIKFRIFREGVIGGAKVIEDEDGTALVRAISNMCYVTVSDDPFLGPNVRQIDDEEGDCIQVMLVDAAGTDFFSKLESEIQNVDGIVEDMELN